MNDRTFSHLQADKLDAPERKQWLPIPDVLEALCLQPGHIVADIGAGTGYFSIPMAQSVGPTGKIRAIDVQPEMLTILTGKLENSELHNVECQAGEAVATGLRAGSCDVVLMANIWHELDQLPRVLAEARRILRSNGRIAILDWSPLADQPPGPPLEHRIGSTSVSDDLAIAGFRPLLNRLIGAYSYLVVAER